MFGCTRWPIIWGAIGLVTIGQVGPPSTGRAPQPGPPEATRDNNGFVEVTDSQLAIYVHPRVSSYLTGTVKQGDRLKVRERLAGGWLAIEPPAWAICWIDGSSLELGSDAVRSGSHFRDPANSSAIPTRSWVAANRAVLRSGHSAAQMPGPPCGTLSKGTMVHLVDRPPIKVGKAKAASTWYAIVPPADVVRYYVRADGTRRGISLPTGPAERLAAYLPAQDDSATVRKLSPSQTQRAAASEHPPEELPAEIAAEIAKIDAMHGAILSDQPIEQWYFETIRARYQAILKRASTNASVEEAVRRRLERLTRHEQAAQAARTIDSILARSHGRDRQVAAERRRSNPARQSARAYSAEGLVKPSAQMVDGRRLYSLVGTEGQVVAYLDVPPGLDIEPLMTRRIGVRGASHYNEDLGMRLITVRDVELLETRR